MKNIRTFIYLLVFINLIITGFFWYQGSVSTFDPSPAGYLLISGRLSGLLAVLLIMVQLLIIGRVLWIEKHFGFDRLAKMHKILGYLIMSLILVHPVFLAFSYAISSKVSLIYQYGDFLNNYEDIRQAVLSVILLVTVVAVTIIKARTKLKYEFWYYVHLFVYLAVLLSFGHQLKLGGDFLTQPLFRFYWYILFIFVFGNFLYYRFFRPVLNYQKHRFIIEKIVKETDEVSSVYIKGKNLESFPISAGQFMIFRFLQKGFWKEAHPFSLSCLSNSRYLRLSVKSLGDYTSRIAGLRPGTRVMIEGPLGSFQLKEGKHKYLFIAAGIGITPIRSLIEQLSGKSDMVLLYSGKTVRSFVFRKELDSLSEKFIFPIHYIVTDESKYQGEKGRIDRGKLLRLVKDINLREIYICGPRRMMADLKNTLIEMKVNPEVIHTEEFVL